jgi:alpha-1,3-rhamnosyl/mannosyltransferase
MPHYVLDARTATPHFPGIGRYVTNLARSLAPLLAPDERLTLLHDPAHSPALSPSGSVQLIPMAVSPFSLHQQWGVPRILRLLAAGRSTSVIYHSPYYLMPYAPRVSTILTVYDLIPLLLPEHNTPRARLLFRWMMTLALHTARAVLAISEATRRDFLAHFHLPPERIVTVPLAADFGGQESGGRGHATRITQHASRNTQHATPCTLPENYLLYLGSNKPHKNLVRLIEAWRIVASSFQLPASSLIIAGAWDERYPEARQRAHELGLGARVRFLGPVAEADLSALYAGATAFVFPSLYEGFGLPVLEAMACGAPVICSNNSSLPEVAGDAALQVDPLDVDALAAAIGRVLGDEALREEMRQRGLRQAARFSWVQTAQQTLEIYRAAAH